jgi:hypothetical protein
VRRNTTRLLCHTSSSFHSQDARFHHTRRVTTRTDMIATKIRVEAFEILKQKSNSATKNITILSTEGFQKREQSGKARDDVRPHKQRPGKAENNGHRFETEVSVSIQIKKCRLRNCYLGTHTRCECHSPRLQGLLLFAFYDCTELGAGQSQCFLC